MLRNILKNVIKDDTDKQIIKKLLYYSKKDDFINKQIHKNFDPNNKNFIDFIQNNYNNLDDIDKKLYTPVTHFENVLQKEIYNKNLEDIQKFKNSGHNITSGLLEFFNDYDNFGY